MRTVVGLSPAVTVLGVGVNFPRLVEAWLGRDVTWRAAAYTWPALVVFVLAALLAATATLLARAWQLWRLNDTTRATNPDPDKPNQGSAISPRVTSPAI